MNAFATYIVAFSITIEMQYCMVIVITQVIDEKAVCIILVCRFSKFHIYCQSWLKFDKVIAKVQASSFRWDTVYK